MRILISGASIAGPVLAYWLERYGFAVTVVERSPALRKAGGHAVDLFKPAMDIAEWMGVMDRIQAKKTNTQSLGLRLETDPGRRREMRVNRLISAVSDRHAEIMRDDLSEIFYDLTRDRVEYVFDDSIAGIAEDPDGVDVTFERGPARRFELVIGADGLHSNVRRLVFGPESDYATWIGGYLAVISLPNYLGLQDSAEAITGVDRVAAIYSAAHLDDARGIFLFRTPHQLDYHHRDVDRQKQLLREAYAGMGWEVPRLLRELDHAPSFYFDSVTQLRMQTWSRGRVSLVGDAGYCPGPAVGGSTSLAMVGAYVLAGELAAAGGDHTRAFAACEREIGDYVARSRVFATGAVRQLIPAKRRDLTAMVLVSHFINRFPLPLARALGKLTKGGVRLHDSVALKDYRAAASSAQHPG